MNQRIVVIGTDTGIGKTVFSAGLANLLGANYWKPIQAGVEGETDTELAARLGGLSADRILPEHYRLRTPASPHHSAEIDGVRIVTESLCVPDIGKRPLVIEGADGLMVPLTRYIDVFERWRFPVVLCASTALGTLRKRHVAILGIAFIGERNHDIESAICDFGRVRWLGRLPWLSPLTPERLQAVFNVIQAMMLGKWSPFKTRSQK